MQAEELTLAVGRHGDAVASILREGCGVGGCPRTVHAGGGFDGPADVLARPGQEDGRRDGQRRRRDGAKRQRAYLRGASERLEVNVSGQVTETIARDLGIDGGAQDGSEGWV